jgi:hypothetical protein
MAESRPWPPYRTSFRPAPDLLRRPQKHREIDTQNVGTTDCLRACWRIGSGRALNFLMTRLTFFYTAAALAVTVKIL